MQKAHRQCAARKAVAEDPIESLHRPPVRAPLLADSSHVLLWPAGVHAHIDILELNSTEITDRNRGILSRTISDVSCS
jgi:hypothetical protein